MPPRRKKPVKTSFLKALTARPRPGIVCISEGETPPTRRGNKVKFYGIPVRNDGRDQMGTGGTISGNYQSVQNYLRYNRKNFDSDTLYAVYTVHDSDWKFQGFHSNLPFNIHMQRATHALTAMER